MLAADTLLRAVQLIVPTVEGITIPDLGDPSTWVIHGLVTKGEGLRALGVIADQIQASLLPPVPTAMDALTADMIRVKQKLGLA